MDIADALGEALLYCLVVSLRVGSESFLAWLILAVGVVVGFLQTSLLHG